LELDLDCFIFQALHFRQNKLHEVFVAPFILAFSKRSTFGLGFTL